LFNKKSIECSCVYMAVSFAINEFGIKYWTSTLYGSYFRNMGASFTWILKKKYDYSFLRSLCSTFVLWKVGGHAVVGKETLIFLSIFGSLPDPVWVIFQEHGSFFYVNIEEKVWLLVRKILTWKDLTNILDQIVLKVW
jgi:hypothetical protein